MEDQAGIDISLGLMKIWKQNYESCLKHAFDSNDQEDNYDYEDNDNLDNDQLFINEEDLGKMVIMDDYDENDLDVEFALNLATTRGVTPEPTPTPTPDPYEHTQEHEQERDHETTPQPRNIQIEV